MTDDADKAAAQEFGDPLEHRFFDRDPSVVAPDLLGRVLASSSGGALTAGRIVEAEAYLGTGDAGSHAATKGVTPRNAVMYGPPGTVYVYFTYGNHHMINLVCGPDGQAGAVLIRALEPLAGTDTMIHRRGERPVRDLCNGPGKLAQALGIDLRDNAALLGEGDLQVYAGTRVPAEEIEVTGRIGLRNGNELPLRFFVRGNPFVSRGRVGPLPPTVRRGVVGGECE